MNDTVIDRVCQSLLPSYKGFVMNYNMQGMEKTIPELFVMLKAMEVEIKKEHQLLMVNMLGNAVCQKIYLRPRKIYLGDA